MKSFWLTEQQQYQAWLKDFWRNFGKGNCKSFRSTKSKKETLEALQLLGKLKMKYKNPLPLAQKRESFKNTKRKGWQEKPDKCFVCRQQAFLIRHHIIWLSNGGGNDRMNVVLICDKCHAEIHPWLKNQKEMKNVIENMIPTCSNPSKKFDILFV